MSTIETISELIEKSGGYSVRVNCPECHSETDTQVEDVFRCCAWIWFCFCCFLAIIPIPCECKPGCVEVRHKCQNCDQVLGTNQL